MGRRGWRAIPPEIGVPIAITAVLVAGVRLVGVPRSGVVVSAAELAQCVTLLCGLRELRRRVAGRVLVAAIAVQAIAVALWIAGFVIAIALQERGADFLEVANMVHAAATILVAALLVTAARCWGYGLVAVVAAALSSAWVTGLLVDNLMMIVRGIAISQIVYAVAILAVCARFEQAPAEPDPGRAARAARRAMWGWRLRAVVFALWLVLGAAPSGSWLRTIAFDVGLFSLVVQSALVMSGMLGLGRAHVAGLPGVAFAIAAYVVLSSLTAAPSVIAAGLPDVQQQIDPVILILAVLQLAATVWAAWRAGGYMLRSPDRLRARAVTMRLVWLMIASILVIAALATRAADRHAPYVGALVGLGEVAAALALASLYRMLHERLVLAATTEAF